MEQKRKILQDVARLTALADVNRSTDCAEGHSHSEAETVGN